MSFRIDPADRVMVASFAAYCLLLLALWLLLSPETVRHTFSEEGIVERASVVGWIAAAIVVAFRAGLSRWRGVAFAALYLVFAAREADLHKAFTADSLFKSAYYRRTVAPFEEKLIAGIVALLIVALLVYFAYVCLRFLVVHSGWRTRAGVWLAFGLGLLVFTKVLDRAPAVLQEDLGWALQPLVHLLVGVFEEGLESFLPVILAWSAWVSPAHLGYLSPQAAREVPEVRDV